MKYQQQVSVDLVNMVYTAVAYLALAGAAWLLLRLIQACFWLPRHMRRQNDVQNMLQDKVDGYERYIRECESREAAEAEENASAGRLADENEQRALEEKRKDRRECLEMLRKELQRIKDGGDPYDFDHLLEDDTKRLLEEVEEELEEEPKDAESRKQGDDLRESEKLDEDEDAEPKKDK